MSTITQETPTKDNQGIDGINLPDYPALPSDEVMTAELANAQAGHLENAVKADQIANPGKTSPFMVDKGQEMKMLPSTSDLDGSLVITGFDKYSNSKK